MRPINRYRFNYVDIVSALRSRAVHLNGGPCDHTLSRCRTSLSTQLTFVILTTASCVRQAHYINGYVCDDIYVNRAANFLYATPTTKFPLRRICAKTSAAFRTKSMPNLMILLHATSINCSTQCSLITLHSNMYVSGRITKSFNKSTVSPNGECLCTFSVRCMPETVKLNE